MKLNIIGNGFDLYHGLPSRYYDFATWLIENDPDLYQDISKYLGVQIFARVRNGLDIEEGDYVVEEQFWSCFEQRLGNVDSTAFEDQLLDDLGLENDDPVSLFEEVNADSIAKNIKYKLAKWIYESVDIDQNYKIIKKNMRCKIKFAPEDRFIVFNYTHTLQRLYRIPDQKIFYIHGECMDENSTLIVGHGNEDIIPELACQIREAEAKYDYTQSSLNAIDEMSCMLSFIKELKKDVSLHLQQLSHVLQEISLPIDEIIIYGFSFGDVDMPYVHEISKHYRNVPWRISEWKKDTDKENCIVEKLTRVTGIEKGMCSFFEFNNPVGEFIRDKILSAQHRSDYELV